MSVITVKQNGIATWHGVEAGPLTLHDKRGKHLVIKAASHKYWSSIGNQKTAPTTFYVFEINYELRADDGTFRFDVKEIMNFPLRKQT